jgi:formylglycine-generating enzyme required for sulfatase activity
LREILMPEPRPLRVFLCHAKEDKPIVREMYRQLTAAPQGGDKGWLDIWLDEQKLLPGQEWDIEIEKAVEQADVVVVCLSSRSVDKEGYVQKEIRFVLNIADEKPEGTIFVVPLRLDDCVVPRRLRVWQYVDYFPKDRRKWAYQRLLESLKLRANKLGLSSMPANRGSVPVSQPEPPVRPVGQDTVSLYEAKPARKFNPRLFGIILSVLVLVSFTAYFIANNLPIAPTETPTAVTHTITFQTPTVIPTSTLGVGSTTISEKDGMTLLYVPAGKFTMGNTNGASDEQPSHEVLLSAFWIDQTEVTNKMYANCVAASKCSPPNNMGSVTRPGYYGNSEFDNYPVIWVSWNDAIAYCEWAGRRLPTEADWEKAACGTDARTYPWGNEPPNSSLLNSLDYNNTARDTTEVGRYPDGRSFYGAYDMAGNVWEWVNDWYDVYPGGNPGASNDFGQKYRVLRGGSFLITDARYVRSVNRFMDSPSHSNYDVGFRCARSASPP